MSKEYSGEFGESINRPAGEHPHPNLEEMDIGVIFDRSHEVTLLDVRDEADYEKSHVALEGAARVSPTNTKWMDGLAKTTEYVVFCDQEDCKTSIQVAQAMRSKGFVKVSVLQATISSLEKAGYPMVKK